MKTPRPYRSDDVEDYRLLDEEWDKFWYWWDTAGGSDEGAFQFFSSLMDLILGE